MTKRERKQQQRAYDATMSSPPLNWTPWRDADGVWEVLQGIQRRLAAAAFDRAVAAMQGPITEELS